jgi:hypothetical protein
VNYGALSRSALGCVAQKQDAKHSYGSGNHHRDCGRGGYVNDPKAYSSNQSQDHKTVFNVIARLQGMLPKVECFTDVRGFRLMVTIGAR